MSRISEFLHTTLNPAVFHGHREKSSFFEGWYFKIINADETRRYAIIPGVFLGEDAHAFIQILDGNSAQSSYHRFHISDFVASKDKFEVCLAGNFFSNETIYLDLCDDLREITGELRFEGVTPWPVTVPSPGIMGWYAWVPKMECYHGVLSFDHQIQGSLKIDGQLQDFTGGRGYTEKDWGKSFPAGYVWLQSNHFEKSGISLTASIAVIPWMRRAFRGFIVGLWHGDQLYRFATYTGAKTEELSVTDDQVHWVMKDRRYQLELLACRAEGGLLHEPTGSEMLQRVEETMFATVEIKLSTNDGRTLFDGKGRNTALEVNGDIPRLLAMK